MKKIIYLALAVIISAVFVALPFIIKVKIICESQYGECPPEINSSLEKINNKTMFIAKKEILKSLKNNYLISNYSTQFKLPNILLVNILSQKPSFALYDKVSSELLAVDLNGTVLANESSTNLPKVITDSKLPSLGQKVDESTLTALKLMQGVWNMYQVGIGEKSRDSLTVELPGRINVIFSLVSDPQLSLGALRIIYTRVMDGDLSGKFSQIDLRFKNPVLR